jgi:hypothetical protein
MPPLGCGIGMYYQSNKEFCLLLLFQKEGHAYTGALNLYCYLWL